MKYVHDLEWNSRGENIKDEEKETEVPCPSGYSLEVYIEGHPSNAEFGPEKLLIPLVRKGDVYTGSSQAEIKFAMDLGSCGMEGIYPESYDVTAQPDEFGVLQFTVHIRMEGAHGSNSCPGPGSWSVPAGPEFTQKFPLEADGSSYSTTEGYETWTYTLREQKKP